MMSNKSDLFGFIIAIALVTAALPGNAQTTGSQTAPGGQAAVGSGQTAATGAQTNGAAKGPDISLYTLLNAAEGGHAVWRPDWPLDVPPDLFLAGSSALSITADFGDGNLLEFSRDSGGKILSFPLLMNAQEAGKQGTDKPGAGNQGGVAADAGPGAGPDNDQKNKVFFQGRCEYNREGRLSKLVWKDPAAQSDESDAEALRWDDEGRPLLWRIFSGDYYFVALEYSADTLIETWYDREGTALFVVITGSEKQTRIDPAQNTKDRQDTLFYYNSWGLLSGIEEPSGDSVSALYNQQGMPRYLELTTVSIGGNSSAGSNGTGSGGSTGNANSVQNQVYSYQWDASSLAPAGKLVRLSGGSPAMDSRYEYTLDSQGNWTERKEFSMKALGPEDWGRLVPYRERTVRRTINYGNSPKAEEPPKAGINE